MMRIIVLVSIALLAAAAGYELFASGYSATELLDAFQSQTLLQKLSWALIIVVPFVLLAATFWEAARHDQQRKTAAVLETRLRGAQKAVNELDDAQKDNDHAANYLDRSDPEDAIASLQRRLIEAERTTHLQQSRSESQGLLERVEQVRQQQQALRERLGVTIEKRRLIEPLFTELQNAQDDLDRRFAALKADDLHERLHALTEAGEKMKLRCGAVEESVAGFVELKGELEALQSRLAPLDNRETGVRSIISALEEVRDQLTVTIERLDRDGETTLAGRASEFAETKKALETRVASLIDQFSTLDQVNRDIRVLFTRLRGEVDAHFLSQNGGPKD